MIPPNTQGSAIANVLTDDGFGVGWAGIEGDGGNGGDGVCGKATYASSQLYRLVFDMFSRYMLGLEVSLNCEPMNKIN